MRRSVVLVAAAATLAAGCSTGQGDPTVAAVVGGVRVSTVDQVQQRLNDLLAHNPQVQDLAKQHKLDQVTRAIVTQDVVHQLTVELAKRANLAIDESLIAQLTPILSQPTQQQDPIQAAVESSYPAQDLVRDKVLRMEIAEKVLGTTVTTIDAAFISTPDKAQDLARQVTANPDKAGDLIKAAGAGPDAAPGGQPILDQAFGGAVNPQDGSPTDANGYMQAAQLPFNSLPAKSVLVWKQTGQDGTSYAVIYISKRQVGSAPSGIDTSQATPQQMDQIGRGQLVGVAQGLGVQLNQRYGGWDPITLAVIPADQLSVNNSVAIPATAKQ